MSRKLQSSVFVPSAQSRFSRHQNKKNKKASSDRDQKQLFDYMDRQEREPMRGICKSLKAMMPGHEKLGIWRKNLSLLSRCHLPMYVKTLDYLDSIDSVLVPSKAHINPKKNNKNDIMIEDPVTQKTRLIKMDNFPIILSPNKLAFYKLYLEEFQSIFQALYSKEEVTKVFNFLLEEHELVFPNVDYLLWPIVVLEGLNYSFDSVSEIVTNFKINTSENTALFDTILKMATENSLSQIVSESNVRIEASEMEDKPEPMKEPPSPKKDVEPGNVESVEQIAEIEEPVEAAKQKSKQKSKLEEIEKEMCIWLIGTAYFNFVRSNLISWFAFSGDTIKKLFAGSLHLLLIKQINFIIESLNKHKKLQDSELKADEYKYFLYRISTYKPDDEEESLCIPLRFEYVKGMGKKVLIKILKQMKTQLKWVATETVAANYTLPNLTKKELNYLYLSQKLSPIFIVQQFMFRDFFYLPVRETTDIFRSYFPYFHVTQEEAYKQRCQACRYVIREMAFKSCFFCQVYCHQECAILKGKKPSDNFLEELFPESGETPWICEKCQPCSICMEAVGNGSLFCTTCFSYFHLECGKIKGVEVDFSKEPKEMKEYEDKKIQRLKNPEKYVCQSCLKCKMCSHRLKDNDYVVMENQFFCSECSDKIKSNNHCHICMKKKEGGSSMKWIQCGDEKCQKWVHEICDPEYISVIKSPTADDPYLCPLCRILEKRKLYIEIIDSLAYFDEAQFFIDSSYKDIPFYCTIISEPMCFNEMKEKVSKGLYDDGAYKAMLSDFNLIINNALKFNMPKDTAHVQAKILKILGEKALQKYMPIFIPDLRSLITGKTIQEFGNLKQELIRQINSHYPQILLNYRCEKSFIELREMKKKTPDIRIEDQKFNSSVILTNLLKNSTILFHLKKQKIGISNLFTMPKSQNERGIWHPIKGDMCYYHPNPEVIYSCNECCESFCCMKECIRHRTCGCGQKGCKCDSYECGCPPMKDKEKKTLEMKLFQKYSEPLKTYRQILMDLTENYKYCLKCAQEKVPTRLCAECGNLCSWGYFKCHDCFKVWHKRCYPYQLPINNVYNSAISTTIKQQLPQQQGPVMHASFVSSVGLGTKNQGKPTPSLTCSVSYCRDCLSDKHENTFQQILTLESKSKLVKLAKISRYMRIFVEVYFNQGIRLTPYEIQQLILSNYDQFSIREQLFKEYELNYAIIERFRDFTFQTNAAIERSCDEYLNDYVCLRKQQFLDQSDQDSRWMDVEDYVCRSANIWKKYYMGWDSSIDWLPWESLPLVYSTEIGNRLYWQTLPQIRHNIIGSAYTYTDFNSYKYSVLKTKLLLEQLQSGMISENSVVEGQTSFFCEKQYKSYLGSLAYIPTIWQSYYQSQHQYRNTLIYHPRSMPFDYRLNPTFKKKSHLESATRQFLMGIYEESKYCLRKGSTCILGEHNGYKHAKDYWSVLKKWGKTKELRVVLQKKGERWYLQVDGGYEKIVNEIDDIIKLITKKHHEIKIGSFKELGEFLGFTIFQPFYKANHFTNFLQTNLVDEMPILERMNKISELYSSFTWGDNAIFSKSGPASLVNSTTVEQPLNEKTIVYEYSMSKTKPPYLSKKWKNNGSKSGSNKKVEKRLANMEGEVPATPTEPVRQRPFITFEDIRKFFILDPSTLPIPQKMEISLKNNTILNEVFIAPSKIHKLGLFSRKFIKKHSIVIEYVGEIVSQSVADLREKKFHYGCYLFGIMKEANRDGQDKKDIIDATFRGNMARYLNHSCDANCKAKTEFINGCPRIIIYTIRDIQQFEQITYDYQFNVDAVEKLQCTCGAKNCQGRLN